MRGFEGCHAYGRACITFAFAVPRAIRKLPCNALQQKSFLRCFNCHCLLAARACLFDFAWLSPNAVAWLQAVSMGSKPVVVMQ